MITLSPLYHQFITATTAANYTKVWTTVQFSCPFLIRPWVCFHHASVTSAQHCSVLFNSVSGSLLFCSVLCFGFLFFRHASAWFAFWFPFPCPFLLLVLLPFFVFQFCLFSMSCSVPVTIISCSGCCSSLLYLSTLKSAAKWPVFTFVSNKSVRVTSHF